MPYDRWVALPPTMKHGPESEKGLRICYISVLKNRPPRIVIPFNYSLHKKSPRTDTKYTPHHGKRFTKTHTISVQKSTGNREPWQTEQRYLESLLRKRANVRFKLRISQQETGNTWSRGTNSRLPFAANVTLGSNRELKQQRF